MDRSPAIVARVYGILNDVLPDSTAVEIRPLHGPFVNFLVNGRLLRTCWIGEGWPNQVQTALALAGHQRPDVLIARRMSPGAQVAATSAGLGWIDESGAAMVSLPWLVISRSGQPSKQERRAGWSPAVLGVAEAILAGTLPTVSAVVDATGLAIDTCTRALQFFADEGYLTATARRGPASARTVADPDRFLDEFSTAAVALRSPLEARIGVFWRDPIAALAELGQLWDPAGVTWAVTGPAASLLLAPFLSDVSTAEIYVDTSSDSGRRTSMGDLLRIARLATLDPMEGGRLVLRPFPSKATANLREHVDGCYVASWPRVFADLRQSGVRGEEAAEHLREFHRAG